MAESGRTPAPRTVRHGHSRAPLSAARRTRDSSGQARLANLCDSAAPASPRAALHLAHSSDRPRSDPDHAAARHARRSQGFRAASRRLDRRASRPFAEGGTVSDRHRRAAARRAAPDRASRRRARHGVDRNPRQRREDSLRRRRRRAYRPPRPRFSQARSAQGSAQGRRSPMPTTLGVKVKRVSIRDQSSRWGSCTSAGSLSFSWRLILAPPYVLDYLAAHEVAHLVEMNHSARSGGWSAGSATMSSAPRRWLDTHGNDLHRYGIRSRRRGRRDCVSAQRTRSELSRGSDSSRRSHDAIGLVRYRPNSRSISQPSSPPPASGRAVGLVAAPRFVPAAADGRRRIGAGGAAPAATAR